VCAMKERAKGGPLLKSQEMPHTCKRALQGPAWRAVDKYTRYTRHWPQQATLMMWCLPALPCHHRRQLAAGRSAEAPPSQWQPHQGAEGGKLRSCAPFAAG